MRTCGSMLTVATVAAVATALLTATGSASELPASTKKYLKAVNLAEDALGGLEQELAVPKEWVDAAHREGTVRINGTWNQREFAILNAPFAERYPKIKVVLVEAGTMNARAVAPLVAFKQKQYLTEVITGFGGAVPEFKEADALEDVTGLPGYKNQIDGSNDPDGKWAAMRLRFWCIGYNTKQVKATDLPKTWDDLLTNPFWRNGNLAIGNRPQLWVLNLRTAKGKEWTENFLKQFFTVVKPQFRNEGMDALLGIMAAGEAKAALPTAEYNVKGFANKGAPVGWHCPEPVPLAPSQIGIMKGNPRPHAARLWTNWMLSREAQLAQYVADKAPPSHKALQRREFLVYPDQIIGRQLAQGNEEHKREAYEMWQQYWK